MRLEGNAAIVTGCAHGIGAAALADASGCGARDTHRSTHGSRVNGIAPSAVDPAMRATADAPDDRLIVHMSVSAGARWVVAAR